MFTSIHSQPKIKCQEQFLCRHSVNVSKSFFFPLFQEGGLDSRKVEMLINCLETGKDIWSDLEKSLLQSE